MTKKIILCIQNHTFIENPEEIQEGIGSLVRLMVYWAVHQGFTSPVVCPANPPPDPNGMTKRDEDDCKY